MLKNEHLRDLIAGLILRLWEIRGENEHHAIDRSGEFALIELLYEGQLCDLECPNCKRLQFGVSRACYEIGKRHIGHPYTCGGEDCPSHTEMRLSKK